jgi:dolichyl-phosphate beta-glucosyltransferase
MENEIYLSIIVPIYNEAKRLPTSLATIDTFGKELNYKHEWIFVVEPSQDNSLSIVQDYCGKNPSAFVIGNKVHRGKGFAVQTGMLHAKGKWVLFMDADLSTPLQEVHHFIKHVQENPQTHILVGDRKAKASNIVQKQGPLRILMGKTLNQLLKSMDLTDLPDTQCGFKLFRQDVVKPLFSNLLCTGFSFDIEILAKAKNLKIPVESKAITWKDDKASTVKVVRDTAKMLRDVAKIYLHLKV